MLSRNDMRSPTLASIGSTGAGAEAARQDDAQPISTPRRRHRRQRGRERFERSAEVLGLNSTCAWRSATEGVTVAPKMPSVGREREDEHADPTVPRIEREAEAISLASLTDFELMRSPRRLAGVEEAAGLAFPQVSVVAAQGEQFGMVPVLRSVPCRDHQPVRRQW